MGPWTGDGAPRGGGEEEGKERGHTPTQQVALVEELIEAMGLRSQGLAQPSQAPPSQAQPSLQGDLRDVEQALSVAGVRLEVSRVGSLQWSAELALHVHPLRLSIEHLWSGEEKTSLIYRCCQLDLLEALRPYEATPGEASVADFGVSLGGISSGVLTTAPPPTPQQSLWAEEAVENANDLFGRLLRLHEAMERRGVRLSHTPDCLTMHLYTSVTSSPVRPDTQAESRRVESTQVDSSQVESSRVNDPPIDPDSASGSAGGTLHPTPHTPHPTPHTLHPAGSPGRIRIIGSSGHQLQVSFHLLSSAAFEAARRQPPPHAATAAPSPAAAGPGSTLGGGSSRIRFATGAAPSPVGHAEQLTLTVPHGYAYALSDAATGRCALGHRVAMAERHAADAGAARTAGTEGAAEAETGVAAKAETEVAAGAETEVAAADAFVARGMRRSTISTALAMEWMVELDTSSCNGASASTIAMRSCLPLSPHPSPSPSIPQSHPPPSPLTPHPQPSPLTPHPHP